MGKFSRNDPAVQAMLRALGNPYAAEQMFEPRDDRGIRPESVSARELLRRSENPHAYDYYLGTESPAAAATAAPPQPLPGRATAKLPKDGFRSECRSIFRRYIPALERGKLRPHHLAFVARNENWSGEIRHALVAELRRYDLTARLARGYRQAWRPQSHHDLTLPNRV